MRGLNCSSVGRWALALILALGLSFAMATGSAFGAEPASKAKAAADLRAKQKKAAAKRWSTVGPMSVASRYSSALFLYSGIGNIKIDLKGKKVTVKNADSEEVSLDSVVQGSRVYVRRKGDRVIIYLLKKPEPSEKERKTDS
jgi:hypothetical protein